MSVIDLGSIYVPTEDGRFMSSEMLRTIEIMKDYDSALSVRWIPPDKRDFDDKEPYMVIEIRNGKDFPVTCVTEDELKNAEWMIASLFKWDAERSGSRLTDLDARNAAKKVLQAKKKADEAEERADLVASVIASPLNTFNLGGGKLIDGQYGARRKSITVL